MARRTTLGVGQFRCEVGDKEANLAKMAGQAREASRRGARLLCFPEMGLTGFDAENIRELAEAVPGPMMERLGGIARDNGLYLIAGLPEIEPETGRMFNSCVLMAPNGDLLLRYRKRCLYLGENDLFTPGDRPALHDADFGKLGMAICYDYIFAEQIRRLADAGAELICHPTAWLTTDVCEEWRYNPTAYRAVGMTRALENTVFYLSANLWGNYDRQGTLRAVGQSSIIAPWGETLAEVVEGEGVAVATVDLDAAEGWRRAAAPYLHDRRRFGF